MAGADTLTGSGGYRPALVVALLVLLSHAYFYGGALSNQNARYNPIFTCIEPGPHHGTLRMDPFLLDPEQGFNTEDWSAANGHYYSNKAPGPLLLGVGLYAMLYHGERALGANPLAPRLSYLNAYALNLGLSVLPAALAAWLFCLALGRLLPGATSRAVGLTAVLLWATMMWPFSTQLWGHVTAAAGTALLVYGLVRRDARGLVLAGLGAGLAVLSEYLAAVLVLVTLAVLLVAALRGDPATRTARRRAVLWFGLGGLTPLLVHMLYHGILFGRWLGTATASENPRFRAADKAFGIFGQLDLDALLGLTVDPYRGLWFSAPVLLLALPGWWCWWRSGQQRPLWAVSLGTALGTLLLNACFNGWHGGLTFGARYLVWSLPLWVLPLAWLPVTRLWQALLAALAALSAAIMLVFTSVSPLVGVDLANPLAAYLPKFLAGDLAPFHKLGLRLTGTPDHPYDEVVARYGAFNLGQLLGLPGLWSLLPWMVLMALGVVWLRRVAREAAR